MILRSAYCTCLLRIALSVMLRGDEELGWPAHFGLKCSSWITVNSGTSSRSACSSIGNTEFRSVREGNCLASRSFNCIMHVVACMHMWIWEQ